VNLLKAFSIFKKRQKTNMKLVLAGRLAWKYGSFTESLKTYKYRDDVVMTGYLEENELARLVGSAYGLIYPSLFEGFGVPVLEAMQCNVAVITSEGSSMQEVAQRAALYSDVTNFNDLADKIILLYKDETLRNKLIENGQEQVKQYSWDTTAALLWQCIMQSAESIPVSPK
jgi:glycosyltransferase involved in cell wall biosynthesis